MKLLVGTYSHPLAGMAAEGEGIYAVEFDEQRGAFGAPELLAACLNPSCLAFDPAGGTVFAGREVFAREGPGLLSFRLSPAGLTLLSEVSLSGELPCHLAFDPHIGRLASAQYGTGDVGLCSVSDGALAPPATFRNEGSGPNATRQEGPHAHCVAFTDGGTVLHTADLGADLIVSRRIDRSATVGETAALATPPGSGPRHMVVTGDERRAYVICELSEDLLTLSRSGLGWGIADVQPAFELPPGREGSGAAIRLSPDGRHLYLSGRRQSRIAVFDVTGPPRRLSDHGTGGACPRDFILSADGDWLLCGHQDSGTVDAHRRDPASGALLSRSDPCRIGSPVALLELPPDR